MPRLLSVIHTPVYGGPHNQVLRLHRPLATRGWDTIVILPDEAGNGAERLRSDGVEVIQIPLHRLRAKLDLKLHLDLVFGFLTEIAHIRRLIREHHIDLVQICGLLYPQGAIAAHLEGVSVVWQLLSTFAPMPLRVLFMPAVKRLADIVMSTGMAVARAHPGATGLGDRLIIFYPPVDTKEFCPDEAKRSAARAELGIPDDGVLIGTVGNQNRQKGHEILVRAAAIVIGSHPNVYFRILGAPTPTNADFYEKHVKAEARSLGLMEGGRLDFVDPKGRVPDLLPGLDLFVLTSREEGAPTSILEAMHCEIPVIASDVGSIKEIVENGVTGLVVPPPSHHVWIANAILELLRYPDLRIQMGKEARRRALERYTVEICTDTHFQAYEAAIEHHRQAIAPCAFDV